MNKTFHKEKSLTEMKNSRKKRNICVFFNNITLEWTQLVVEYFMTFVLVTFFPYFWQLTLYTLPKAPAPSRSDLFHV